MRSAPQIMRQGRWAPWYYLAPALLIMLIFIVYPTVRTFYVSIRNDDNSSWASDECEEGESCWGILENYHAALTKDQVGAQNVTALKNTALWLVIMVPGTVILGLLFAVLTDRVKYESFAKSLIFMPMAISFVGAGVIWRFVYDADANIGLLNAIIGIFGVEPQTWRATDPPGNTIFIIIVGIWVWTGFTMTIIAAALKGIPDEILEASRVDGANEFQVFFRIMLPQLIPTLAVVMTTMTIITLKIFDIVWVMRGIQTDVLATRMVDELTGRHFGLSASFAVIIIILTIPIMIYNVRRFTIEEGQR